MIAWPDVRKLNPEGQRGLALFRESGASAELEASPSTWRVVSWPWNDEAPVVVDLANEDYEVVTFTLGEDGIWTLTEAPIDVRLRSPDELEREAEALVEYPSAPPLHI